MRIIALLLLFSSVCSASTLLSSSLDGISWPRATVLAGFSKPTQALAEVRLLPAPQPTPLPIRIWSALKPRHELFILIPGTGGDSSSSNANLLAEILTDNGYDVLIVANPFSSDFQKSFSADGAIGFPQRDLPAVVDMIQRSVSFFALQKGTTKKVHLLGYSLGATYALLLKQAFVPGSFGYVLALHPPVDFHYGIAQIDSLIQRTYTDPSSRSIVTKGLLEYLHYFKKGVTDDTVNSFLAHIKPQDQIDQEIIGASFGQSLRTIAGQYIELRNLPLWQKRQMKAKLSFMTFDRFLGWSGIYLSNQGRLPPLAFSKLEAQMNFDFLLSKENSTKGLYVIHAQDDLLIKSGDLNKLGPLLGDHLFVFKSGGHCGEFYSDAFKSLIRDLIGG